VKVHHAESPLLLALKELTSFAVDEDDLIAIAERLKPITHPTLADSASLEGCTPFAEAEMPLFRAIIQSGLFMAREYVTENLMGIVANQLPASVWKAVASGKLHKVFDVELIARFWNRTKLVGRPAPFAGLLSLGEVVDDSESEQEGDATAPPDLGGSATTAPSASSSSSSSSAGTGSDANYPAATPPSFVAATAPTTSAATTTATRATIVTFGVTIALDDMRLKQASHVVDALQTMAEKVHTAISKREERVTAEAPKAKATPTLAATTISATVPTNFGTTPAPVPEMTATPNPFVPFVPPDTVRINPIPPQPPPPGSQPNGADGIGHGAMDSQKDHVKRRCPNYPDCRYGRHSKAMVGVCLYWNWMTYRPPSHVPVRSSSSVSLDRLNREAWVIHKATWTMKEAPVSEDGGGTEGEDKGGE
jgi:hypothetical protein